MLALEKSKLKKTKARVELILYLSEEHGPFSIDELSKAFKAKGKTKDFDLVTLYRCMATFEKVGLVRRCDFGDGVARYEYQEGEDHHHHHVICKKCRRMESLEHCKLPKLEGQVRKLGFTKISHQLEFFGICSECNASGGA